MANRNHRPTTSRRPTLPEVEADTETLNEPREHSCGFFAHEGDIRVMSLADYLAVVNRPAWSKLLDPSLRCPHCRFRLDRRATIPVVVVTLRCASCGEQVIADPEPDDGDGLPTALRYCAAVDTYHDDRKNLRNAAILFAILLCFIELVFSGMAGLGNARGGIQVLAKVGAVWMLVGPILFLWWQWSLLKRRARRLAVVVCWSCGSMLTRRPAIRFVAATQRCPRCGVRVLADLSPPMHTHDEY